MDASLKHVDPTELVVGPNVRVDANMRIEELAHSIEDMGIQTPIVAWVNPDGDLEVLEGHRRRLSALAVQKRSPDIFKRLHPKGVPVVVRKDIKTATDAAAAKVDHGTILTLKFKCERDRAVGMLLDQSHKEEEIIHRCEGLFAKFQTSVPSKKRDELESLKKDPVKNRKKIRKLLHETYKGQFQAAKAVWECPPVVRACMEHLEAKQPMPKGQKCPAKLTYADCKSLAKALREDCAMVEGKPSPYSKANPGPKFGELWADLLKAAPKPGAVRPKGMSAKDMLKQVETGIWSSDGFKSLTMQHAGDKDVKGLQESDRILYLVETVRKHKPASWKSFKAEAEKLLQEIATGVSQ